MKTQSHQNNGAAAPGEPLKEGNGAVPFARRRACGPQGRRVNEANVAAPQAEPLRMATDTDRMQRSKFRKINNRYFEQMNQFELTTTNSDAAHAGSAEAPVQAFQLAAIKVPVTEELTASELRLWYYLAPYAVDRLRIHYSIEEVDDIFFDYLQMNNQLIERLMEMNVLARISGGDLVPTVEAVAGGLFLHATPSEVMDGMDHGKRIPYFTLRGIIWLLEALGVQQHHPYSYLEHPCEVLKQYRRRLENESNNNTFSDEY